MKVKKIIYLIIINIVLVFSAQLNSYSTNDQNFTNTTRAYFCAEITKGYGNGDCILLENYDSSGNKIYGLIDSGREIEKKDANNQSSTVVKEFLKAHGVERLEFFAITHSHEDHNGDALTVIDNFEIETIYMKEYDTEWTPNGTQGRYEDIIERAVAKNIKVVGVSYLALTSDKISPSRSQDFIINTQNAREELFEGFNENNTTFQFGSSTIKIFNWEIFNSAGEQIYVSSQNGEGQYVLENGEESSIEIVDGDNNNSIAFLLTQGNKKAFFSGDMNNLDKNEQTGRVGDEDRIKDAIGKVDFLKLGHHGYQYSNTEDYINVLNPEFAAITNDMGKAYKDIAEWLDENEVQYLYTTCDSYGISATISNDSIYLGFETAEEFKNIKGKVYYVPEGNEYKDYTNALYKLEYTEKNIESSSWQDLKEKIDNNKNEIINLDENNKICNLFKLNIDLKNEGDWTATETIIIEQQQQICLKTSQDVTLLRGNTLIDTPLFYINGLLDIGKQGMTGTITLDGNKANVEAKSSLIQLEEGVLNLNESTTLCNNLHVVREKINQGSTVDYTAFGSAIRANNSIININGGNIINNSQDVILTCTLAKNITSNTYRCSALGTGVFLSANSTLNMNSGRISNNEAQNHSIVNTNNDYTTYISKGEVVQGCMGVGIYASSNSELNLNGGEVSNNSAKNYAVTNLKKATNESIKTKITSLNQGIYGTGICVQNSRANISNNFKISNNTAELKPEIRVEEDVTVANTIFAGIKGLEMYINNTETNIDGISISNGQFSIDKTGITNNGNASITYSVLRRRSRSSILFRF